jgi:predicted RNA-binding Zn-ribbon protein involved in translation (DUF1610 family)
VITRTGGLRVALDVFYRARHNDREQGEHDMVDYEQSTRPCPYCGTAAAKTIPPSGTYSEYECPKCGTFRIIGKMESLIENGADASAGRFVYWHGNRFLVL